MLFVLSAAGCLAGILYWDEALASVPTEAGTDTSQVSAAADRPGAWHGQCGQDYVIAATFAGAKARYFVDLAANDPVIISNTRALERDLGWAGICVDANPSLLKQLARRRACAVVGAAVSDSSHQAIKFHFGVGNVTKNHHSLGRIVGSNNGKPESSTGGGGAAAMWLRPATLHGILHAKHAPAVIDFLSLDVEGHEAAALLPVLSRNATRFLALVIERPTEPLQKALLGHDYSRAIGHLGAYGDQLWLHASFPGGVAAATARAKAATTAWAHRVRFKSNSKGVDAATLPAPQSFVGTAA